MGAATATPYSTIKLSTEHYLWEQNASLSLSLSHVSAPSAIRRNLGNSSVAPPFIPSFKSTFIEASAPVFSPRGQWPSRMDQRVSGDVKTQRKKSEKARVTMKELRGSALSWGKRRGKHI